MQLNMISCMFKAFGIFGFFFAIDIIRGQNQPFPVVNPDENLFVAFGPDLEGNPDDTVPVNDDGSTGSIPISTGFPLFDGIYHSLVVSTNGVIGPQGVEQYTSDLFSLDNGRKMIAPFWADVDTRMNGGRIYYRFV